MNGWRITWTIFSEIQTLNWIGYRAGLSLHMWMQCNGWLEDDSYMAAIWGDIWKCTVEKSQTQVGVGCNEWLFLSKFWIEAGLSLHRWLQWMAGGWLLHDSCCAIFSNPAAADNDHHTDGDDDADGDRDDPNPDDDDADDDDGQEALVNPLDRAIVHDLSAPLLPFSVFYWLSYPLRTAHSWPHFVPAWRYLVFRCQWLINIIFRIEWCIVYLEFKDRGRFWTLLDTSKPWPWPWPWPKRYFKIVRKSKFMLF